MAMHDADGHNQCFNEYLNLPYLSFGKGQIKEHHSIDNFLNYKMLITKKDISEFTKITSGFRSSKVINSLYM